MPTTLWGITLYVAALFPGVAYAFAREGHRAVARRSVLRETVTLVFVSFVCDAIVVVILLIVAVWFRPIETIALQFIQGDYSWAKGNLLPAVLFACIFVAATTSLGYAIGSKWMHERVLKTMWNTDIPRDKSAWATVFEHDSNQVVDVALVLKSGAWVGGVLHDFDNDPDEHANRAITITKPSYREVGGEKETPLTGTAYLVICASEIELLQVSLREAPPADDFEQVSSSEGSPDQKI